MSTSTHPTPARRRWRPLTLLLVLVLGLCAGAAGCGNDRPAGSSRGSSTRLEAAATEPSPSAHAAGDERRISVVLADEPELVEGLEEQFGRPLDELPPECPAGFLWLGSVVMEWTEPHEPTFVAYAHDLRDRVSPLMPAEWAAPMAKVDRATREGAAAMPRLPDDPYAALDEATIQEQVQAALDGLGVAGAEFEQVAKALVSVCGPVFEELDTLGARR